MADNSKKTIAIVGGGFGGVACALALAKKKAAGLKIILISDKNHVEYNPALYRVVAGRSPMAACIPLAEIFSGKNVEIEEDKIVGVDLGKKELTGSSESRYSFDYLVLALGSESNYFGIPGLEKSSFKFKSINDALLLKDHLHKLFSEKEPRVPVVVIGGGASGVEVAGGLAVYLKRLAKNHDAKNTFFSVNLFEASSKLLSTMPEDFGNRVEKRLHSLGVNIFKNRPITKEEPGEVFLKDMEMETKTLVWTAGAKPNSLLSQINGLSFDKRGKVLVDEFLQAKGRDGVFVVGDITPTKYSGMGQAAIHHGNYVAKAILKMIKGEKPAAYSPKKPFWAVPVGPGWAGVLMGKIRIYGWLGWQLRHLGDLHYFISILSLPKALAVLFSQRSLCESCKVCETKIKGR